MKEFDERFDDLDRLMRRVGIVADRGADAGKLVGGN